MRSVSSGRAFLSLPKSLALTGLKPPSNIQSRWCSSETKLPTFPWWSTRVTTESCCTSASASLTRLCWTASMPSRKPSKKLRLPAWTRCGRCHPVGTPPSGAVWPLPPRGPSTSRTLMARASRSSSDTSPNLTTGNKSYLFFLFIFFFQSFSVSRSLSHVFLSLSLSIDITSFLSVIFYLFSFFFFFPSSSPSLLCTDSIFFVTCTNIYIMSLKSLLKTHDDNNHNYISRWWNFKVGIYTRNSAERQKTYWDISSRRQQKKKRLIKEKMDIEKKEKIQRNAIEIRRIS